MNSEFELYDRIQDSIYGRVDEQFDMLNDAERTFFFIDWLNMQVHNGGWHQWYYNWPEKERRQRIDETIDALRAIDAADTTALLKQAVAILDGGGDALDDRLSELDEALWDQPDDLATLIQDWARERIDQFAVEMP